MSDPNKSPNPDPNSPKNWAIGIGAVILLFVVLQIFNPGVPDTLGGDPDNITFADVKKAVQDDSTVKTVQFGRDMWGNEIVTVKRSNQKDMVAGVPPGGATEQTHRHRWYLQTASEGC